MRSLPAPRVSYLLVSLLAALHLGVLTGSAAAVPTQQELQARCDLGISLALSGNNARAESLFVSVLSQSPRDPRALTNLGNIHLIRGEPDLALAFYERAAAFDTSDAGIVLNQAVALTLLNEAEAADARARRGVEKAGGVHEAASLLGLRSTDQTGDARDARGADVSAGQPSLAKDEIASLLNAARRSVPVDSVAAAGKGQALALGKQAPRSFRSAGTRASGEGVVADVIYWKH